jgi:hypothetical protein
MIKIVDIKGLGFDDEYKPLSKGQQQYVAKKIREALEEISVKAKVHIE